MNSQPGHSHAPDSKKADKTDLEMFLRVHGPELLKKHAVNILLFLMLIAAATMFFYNRSRAKAAEQAATNQNTAIAYDSALQARKLFASPAGDARDRQQIAKQVFDAADLVLASDAGSSQKAAALLSRAEVLWMLGNTRPETIAATQPVLGFRQRTPAEYLSEAEGVYTEILTKYAGEKEYAANALLSLAAIHETRSNFDEARKKYQQVIDDASLRGIYREIATSRLELMEQNSAPYLLATPPATRPADLPVMLTPPPVTQPATQPTPAP